MTPAPMTATARQAHMPVEPGELPIPPTPVIPDPARPVIDPPLPGDVPIKPPEPTNPPIIPPRPNRLPIGDPPAPPFGAGRH
ncbi:MAG: hypothetical protein Q8M01_18200 [Rubrivivax sp.]|nr:hypothetical protein [Rubrivivax sp.]